MREISEFSITADPRSAALTEEVLGQAKRFISNIEVQRALSRLHTGEELRLLIREGDVIGIHLPTLKSSEN